MTRVAIHGAAGRMGQRLIALGSQEDGIELVGAIEASGNPLLGQDAGMIAGAGELSLPLSDQLPTNAEAVIDFSVPAGAESITQKCLDAKIPLVMATTGLEEDQKQAIRDAANTIPIVWAPSMSTAVNLTMMLATKAASVLKNLPSGVDVEVSERHHRFKEDAPSGTALRFGELLAEEMGITNFAHGRVGQTGQRPRNEIGYHALRVGDNPGEHTIVFGMLGETIEMTVRATNRDCYALGALSAAKFVATKEPGIYTMADVLGL